MKKLFLIIMVFKTFSISAQTYIPLGADSDSTLYGPIYNFGPISSSHSWNMAIYTQAEILAAGGYPGNILGVSYIQTDTGAYLFPDGQFEIFIKHTSIDHFITAADFNIEVVGADLVYNSTTQTIPAGPAQVDFNFSNPFNWNGVDNIMLLFRWYKPNNFTGRINWRSSTYTDYKTSFSLSLTTTMGNLNKSKDRANVILNLSPQTGSDAGVISIDSLPGHCAGNINVYSTFKNYGHDSLSNVQVNWDINGIVQTPVTYNGSIPFLGTAQILLGTANLSNGNPLTIRSWTSDPNGTLDTINTNDTIIIQGVLPGLNGTYTIGSGANDFSSVVEATNQLNHNGVCGPVEFIIDPGTYFGKLTFNKIANASAINSITLKSSTLDSSTVIIEAPSSLFPDSNYTVLLNGVEYLTLKSLTVLRSDTFGYSTALKLENGANHINIQNNQIIGSSYLPNTFLTLYIHSNIVYLSNSEVNNISIQNNSIIGNGNGIWLEGDTSNLFTNVAIDNNKIEALFYSIYLENIIAPTLSGNLIFRHDTTLQEDYYGINLKNVSGPTLIAKNKITSYNGFFGIRLLNCLGDSTNRFTIKNNFVQAGSDDLGRCIGLAGSTSHVDILNNSLNFTGTHSTRGRALAIEGINNSDIRLINNIACNSGGGYSIYVSLSADSSISSSDYNCLYTSGDTLAYFSTSATVTLSDFQNATLTNSHSINANPMFLSFNDLHTVVGALDNTGVPVSGVTDDIDGEVRDLVTPDIGADEFTSVGFNMLIENNSLKIYPNPADDFFWLFADKYTSDFTLRLFDVSGREVNYYKLTGNINKVNISNLNPGIYIVKIEIKDVVCCSRLVKY